MTTKLGVYTVTYPSGLIVSPSPAVPSLSTIALKQLNLYTVCPQKVSPLNILQQQLQPNLHRFKWNFAYPRRHAFLLSTTNFIRIPYSVYEIFNSFKLLSQISVTDTTYLLADVILWLLHLPAGECPSPPCQWDGCATVSWDTRLHQPSIGHRTVQISIRWTVRFGEFCRNESTAARSVTSTIWKNGWSKSGVVLIRTLLTELCGYAQRRNHVLKDRRDHSPLPFTTLVYPSPFLALPFFTLVFFIFIFHPPFPSLTYPLIRLGLDDLERL